MINDLNDATAATTQTVVTMSVPVSTIASFGLFGGGGNAMIQKILITPIGGTDTAPAVTAAHLINDSGGDELGGIDGSYSNLEHPVNGSSQLNYRASNATQIYINTYGWYDTRGRLS